MVSIEESANPTALGMFSKPGRFTSQKYMIFSKKDDILQDRRQYLKVSHFPAFDMQFQKDEEKSDDGLAQKYGNPKNAEIEQVIAPKPKSTFDKYTGRYEHYLHKRAERLKKESPMVGLYHPKKIVANVKNLPDYTKELKQRYEIDRFEFFVDKRHLDEMKD